MDGKSPRFSRRENALRWIGVFAALCLLAPLGLLGAVLAWPRLPLNVFTGQLENLYGFLGAFGFVTLAIIGMLHKIVPFLAWFKTYSPHVGRFRVPTLAALYSEHLQRIGYWTWLTGLAAAGAGILLQSDVVARLGVIALSFTLLMLAVNIAKILSHVLQPKLSPLPGRAKSS